jgi:hypothetical protein
VLAAFLSSIYPGYIYYSKFLSQESTMTFLLLLFVYLIITIRAHPTWKNHLLAGVFLGMITIYRPAYQFLFAIFFPIFIYSLWANSRPNWRKLCIACVSGFMIIMISWSTFSLKVHNQILLSKSSFWAFHETLRNDGWVTDDYFPLVDDNLSNKLQAMGYPPPPKGILLDFEHALPTPIYLKLGLNWIKNYPLETFLQIMKRIFRTWFYLETYPAKWHSSSTGVQLFVHRLLVIAALLGISLSLSKLPFMWIMYVIIFYANLQIFQVGIPRYNIPSMSFILLLASYTLVYCIANFRKAFIPITRIIIICILGFILTSFMAFSPAPPIIGTYLWLLPWLRPEDVHFIRIIAANLSFLFPALLVYAYLKDKGRLQASINALLFLALTLPVLNSVLITNKVWHEWRNRLQDKDNGVVQKIYMPQELKILPSTKADLFIDMFGGEGQDHNIVVVVNGRQVKSYTGGLHAEREKFAGKFFGLYEYFFFQSYHLRPEDMRQWYRIRLDYETLKSANPVVIECRLEGNFQKGGEDYVYIFGDYVTERHQEKHIFEGPIIPSTNQDTSLYKIMPYDGDYRFDATLKLQSEMRKSFLCAEGICQDKDLSNIPGIQTGTFRIYLRLLDGENQILL